MRHDERTFRLLKRISRERDFVPFLHALAQERAQDSLTQDGAPMYRSQGMSLALVELAALITRAAEIQ